MDQNAVAVGSLESQARGQGARKNGGKPQWWQLPWWTVHQAVNIAARGTLNDFLAHDSSLHHRIFELLSDWQRGDNVDCLEVALAYTATLLARNNSGAGARATPRDFLEVVRVLEFGAKKYAVGNWTKGMPWSVCLGCALSHLFKAMDGEDRDEESGLSHDAHLACNLIFLIAYYDIYPEGDDRLPGFRVGGIPRVDAAGADNNIK